MIANLPELSQAKLKSIKKLKQKKYRYQNKRFICEGWRMFTAAISANPDNISEVVVNEQFLQSTHFNQLVSLCRKKNVVICKTPDKIFSNLSDELSPSGLLFVCEMNFFTNSDLNHFKSNYGIYLEQISDPGNLGTIIRSAAWFGFKEIFLSPECVDPFNSKVVRSSAGGIFAVNIYLDITVDEMINFADKKDYQLIGTTLNDGQKLSNWKVKHKNIIFFGNEANGLSDSTMAKLHTKITITGSSFQESLNLSVTAGIIMNHLFQQKITK